ncbi:hypothetical protein N9043_00715 [bacterium]|nr:hypothetical protein [bacterium]
MLGCNTNTPPACSQSCIKINDWSSSPQGLGCLVYKGKYYVNLLPGNMIKPDDGLLSGSYAVGSADYCAIIKYYSDNQDSCDQSSEFMKFFGGIKEYSCIEDKTFDCDEFIIFKNDEGGYELIQSLIKNNKRHPHDRDSWKSLGDFSHILKFLFDDADGRQLTLRYWEECRGKNCSTVYNNRDAVVERVENGEVDSCDNKLYDDLIYLSLKDCNTDKPSVGASLAVPTWQGPYTESEWFDRQVGFTVNGDPIRQGDNHILVSKDDFCEGLEWKEVDQCEGDCDPVLVNKLCPVPIGTDENDVVITNGSQSNLLSETAPCDKFEWVDTESGSCESDCTPETIRQFCPKPVGVDENGDVINNGSESELISIHAPYEPLQWVDVETEDCLPDCEHPTKKRLTLCIDKGLHIVESCLEVLIDATKGLGFNEDGSIFVKIKNGLGFTEAGEIEVVPADDSIIVDETGVKVGQIGVDRDGNPIMAGACLVTCDTDLHATAVADVGTQTTITLSNGTVVSGPRIDADDYVNTFTNTVNADGSITVTITMLSGTVLTHTLPAPEVEESPCATAFQYARVDAFSPIATVQLDAPISDVVVEFYNETINIPAADIQAGGVPACADVVEIVAITNVTHNADANVGHLNIDSRVIVDGFSSRSFNSEALANRDDDHDYERNTGFARLNANGSLDIDVRFMGNRPSTNEQATAVATVKILGWGVQSVLN